MKISKIVIENIRGISLREFDFTLSPNNPIFFVAPNGFGKTSIATAFNSMKRNRIELEDENRHNNDQIALPSIKIINDTGAIYHATSNSNTITNEFAVYVINSQVKAKASSRSYGGYTSTTSSLVVDPIILYRTIPSTVNFSYSFTDMKNDFGTSAGKLLINLTSKLQETNFVELFSRLDTEFDKLLQSRNNTKINDFLREINAVSGTKTTIANASLPILNIGSINNIIEEFDFLFHGLTQNEKLVNTLQLKVVYENNKVNLSNIFKYYEYLSNKAEINEMLSFFNCTWKNIKACKRDSKFIIEFPNATQISNGERDVLYFIGKLFEARKKLSKRKAILIIDEIFDYLDDANLIAVQYFLIKFIEQFKKAQRELFPIILTHLDPMFFNTYSFSTKNVVYLDKVRSYLNKHKINNLLKDRDNCKKQDKPLYERISSHYLHYSPHNIDETDYLQSIGVETELYKSHDFQRIALQELEEYKNGSNFDPALVCCGLRIYIEKLAYEKLNTTYQTDFLTKFKTIEKLEYAKEKGVNIPEVCFLLSIIYNEAMHLDAQCQKINPITSKLKNKVIHNMISEI